MLNDEEMYYAVSEVARYPDRDAYISDVSAGLANRYDDGQITDDEWNEKVKEFAVDAANIYDCCRLPVTELIRKAGLTQSAFALRYCISLRTVQHWCNGDRSMPIHLKLLICKDMGILRVK